VSAEDVGVLISKFETDDRPEPIGPVGERCLDRRCVDTGSQSSARPLTRDSSRSLIVGCDDPVARDANDGVK
jgi:hypothetical protein